MATLRYPSPFPILCRCLQVWVCDSRGMGLAWLCWVSRSAGAASLRVSPGSPTQQSISWERVGW